MNLKMEEHQKCVDANQCQTEKPCLCNISCIDGKADEYECSNVDLLSFVPLKDLGSNGDGSDIWGWTDPETGREYALVGCEDGTSFVDVTEPTDPKVVGFLPTHTSLSYWRDIKVMCICLYTRTLCVLAADAIEVVVYSGMIRYFLAKISKSNKLFFVVCQ